MSKRLFFLTSIILAFSFCAPLKAGPIDDPNYNLGFEFMYDVNGDPVTNDCHYGLDSIPGWVQGGTGAWAGVDVNCGHEGSECDNCKAWLVFTEGWSHCYISENTTAYQLFDPNYDSNVILTEGRQYTVTFDAMAGNYETNPVYMDVSIFYVDDPNFPDANRHVLVKRTVELIGYSDANGLSDWQYDEVIKFVAEAGQPYLGKPFGVEFENVGPAGYLWVDNVRLEWGYATYAYEPSPADGEVDVSRDVVLNWKASGYAQSTDGHDVYFGTDYNSVRDANESSAEYKVSLDRDVNYYDPTPLFAQLDLGQVYYWRVDEINDAYAAGWQPGDEPPAGPWIGDVWSFEVTGYASNPSPADGAVDIPFLNLTLSWDAATSATSYDVYFGTDYNSVRDANDLGAPGPGEIYRSHQSGLSYLVPESLTTGLNVGGTYYWRIDPTGGADLTGRIWSFTIGEFLIVDDMESYDTSVNQIYDTWEDGMTNGSDSWVILIFNDVNRMHNDTQTMELEYDSVTASGGKHVGSWVNANPADLAIGTDWTVGGVKSLDMYFRGDPCNVTAGTNYGKLWLELQDTGAVVHYLVNNDANLLSSDDWTVWHIDLEDFNSAGVDLSSLAVVRIGVAGTRTNQPGNKDVSGFVYIDDIRLYPPRCRPEVSSQTGDFTSDCKVNYYDLDVMATDWMLMDGNNPTGNRPAVLTGFPDATSHWVSGYIGSGAIEVTEGYNIDVDDPRLNGLASMSMTAWVKQTIVNNWVGIVSSREEVGCGDDATEIGIYGSQWGGPGAGALGYDWSCGGEEWNHAAGLVVPSDGTWTFVAISVDPTGGTLYQRPAGGALQTGIRNTDAHAMQQNFSEGFWIGRSKAADGYMVGAIDDVRIYTYALDFNDVNNLAYQTADPNPWPVYRYEFDETSGYTAADTGTPTIVYGPVPSVANLADPEPKLQRAVNFVDYAILADNWLEELMWP